MILPLGGAQQRLLPEAIPSLFFGTAIAAHVLAWAGLIPVAHELPGFTGGPGPVLAVFHTLTIGVLMCTAFGASLQMLPVAFGRPAPRQVTCIVVYLALLAGLGLLVTGLSVNDAMIAGAAAASLSIAAGLYVAAIFRILFAARGISIIRYSVAVALVSLSVAVVFALALTVDYQFPLLGDHHRVALAHAVLTSFGFMGMLVFAFSHILIPMFAMAEAPAGSVLDWTFALLTVALAGAVVGCLCAWPVLTSIAGGVGLVGALLHVAAMAKTVKRRMRKRMGPEFIFIRVSWCMLPVGILLANALTSGLLSDTWPAVTIVVVAYGWLLTLLLGVLQHILPFLASMHSARSGPGLLSPSRLTVERPLRFHLWCHFGAVAAVVTGAFLAVPEIIQIGAAAGTIGALAFGWFAITIFRRTRRHCNARAIN